MSELKVSENVLYGGDELPVFANFSSLGELILHNLTKNGDKTIIIDGIFSSELTSRDLKEKSIILAKSMRKHHGISKNDTISIVSENRLDFPPVVCSTLLLNARISPINLTYSERELAHAFNLSKPSLIFVSPHACDKVVPVAKSLSFIKGVVLFGEENPFEGDPFVIMLDDYIKEMQSAGNLDFKAEPVDLYNHIAVILNSSGTTGLPKGVALTHANIMSSVVFVLETVLKLSPIPRSERFILGIIPWFHAFGFLTTFSICVTAEATLVGLPKFEEGLFLSCIENYRTSIIFMVPPLMVFLAKSPLVDTYDLSSLKEVIVGAAPLKASTELAVKKRIGNNLVVRQGFGMSELTLATTIQKNIFKPGSVGDLNPGQWAKIVDENDRALGPNKPGELLVKGTQRMHSYFMNEQATRETITPDGWLRTGDVAYYDEDQQFFIIDRLKELIKYKGFQVPPAEIEGILLKHPSNKEAAVIGIPDEEAGELPLAFVVKQDNVEITEQEVKDFVAKQASKAKQLNGGVLFIEEIPKNLSGKILRRQLREIARQKLSLKSKL